VRVLEKLAAVKLADERLVDLAAGEVEPGDIAIVREALWRDNLDESFAANRKAILAVAAG
jgi:hypothetical protein